MPFLTSEHDTAAKTPQALLFLFAALVNKRTTYDKCPAESEAPGKSLC